MPARDGTGPNGEGPRTGRGFGDCMSSTKETSTEEDKPEPQRGRGLGPCGQGLGRGFRRGQGRGLRRNFKKQ